MSKATVNTLIAERNDVFEKIKHIEETCEGIDNVHNQQKISQLNQEKAKLISDRTRLAEELEAIEKLLTKIQGDISQVSGKGAEKILEAIKNQRWYFFKNKPDILFDKYTGYLWPNLDHFKYFKDRDNFYQFNECKGRLETLTLDGYLGWKMPTQNDVIDMIEDKSFPFHEGSDRNVMNFRQIYINDNGSSDNAIWLDYDFPGKSTSHEGIFLPVYKKFCERKYRDKIREESNVYSERERLQFTLDLFVSNDLIPIFKEAEVTDLYKNIYMVKPALLEKLNEIQAQLDNAQKEVLLSSTFDYDSLLVNYQLTEIDNSVIKYYQSVQSWINELMDKLHYFEKVKEAVISDFNVKSIKLSKKYENNPNLTDNENTLFKDRQRFFKKHFELGMNHVKTKLLKVKQQANDIEDQIEEINEGNDVLKELALLEKEERASFKFIIENTTNMIKNALLKIEFFEKNSELAARIIELEDKWTEDYKVFKTTKKDELKHTCEEDHIEDEYWMAWYEDWCNKRFILEGCFLPLVEKGLKGEITTTQLQVKDADTSSITVIEEIIQLLDSYKSALDEFYLEERKNVHIEFALSGGDLQEKFKVESELYKVTAEFQKKLQDIIFSLENSEDRIFLLKWAEKLLDIQINEILDFVKDQELSKISQEVLQEFSNLKKKNYESFITDAKAYSEERANREKQYNSLMFKMRKDLMK